MDFQEPASFADVEAGQEIVLLEFSN